MIERAHGGDRAEVERLLEDAGLPALGAAAPSIHLFVMREGGRIVGAVALEGAPPVALLRSLVVAPSHRGRGLGIELVLHAEQAARERGIETLHLLTTTAAAFFVALGYQETPRDGAPAAILATEEFHSGCPASATSMARRVAAA